MTLLDSPSPVRARSTGPVAAESRAPKDMRAAAVQRTVRIATGALVVVAVVGGLFAVFDGPIGNAWYTTRQHQLASQWQAQRSHVGRGKAIALLQIPRLHLSVLVAEGDAPQQLRSGPGHRIGTPAPGAVGNSVIVGHRVAWGGPFGGVSTLEAGDYIAVQTQSAEGPVGVFDVVSVRSVAANDLSPFAGSSDRRLTIVTGTGGRFSDRRLVVTAVSGPVGRLVAPTAVVHATTSGGSPVWNAEVALAVGALAVALALWWVTRRRYRLATVAVVASPLVVLAVLALLLDLEAALPALR